MLVYLHRRRRNSIVCAVSSAPIGGPVKISAAHACPWSDAIRLCIGHHLRYSIALATQHRTPYGLHGAASQHRARYSLRLATQHRTPWADALRLATQHRAPWHLLTSAASTMRAVYSITSINPVAAQYRTPYALLDDAWIQTVANTPVLRHAGRTLAIAKAQLSSDEQSPFWLAAFSLATPQDHAGIAIGDRVDIDFGADTFALVVDGKTISRASAANATYSISAISALALLDAPYAELIDYARSADTLASTAVAELIGPVTWALPDWPIPAAALQISGATPLAAARSIVSAIGGLIESTPAGAVVCRARHPVSVPDYASTPPAHTLPDSAIITASARMAPLKGYNRITVANTLDASATGSSDVLEYVADPDSTTTGTVRARLGFARAVLLVHSGHPDTVITAQGSVTRSESELVEFVAGQSNTSYPADSISGCVWQHVDLGALAIDSADRTALVAGTSGYSLAQLSYLTTAMQWRVALPTPSETVQFILIDA